MKRKTLALAGAAGLCLLACSSAPAAIMDTPPVASFSIDGNTITIPSGDWTYDPEYDTWEMDPVNWSVGGEGTDSVQIYAGGKYDPMLTYTFAPIDFGAPSTFTFSISMPIMPTGPATTVDASISGGLNDFTGNGVTLTPNPLNGDPDGDSVIETQVARLGNPLTNMGVDVGLVQSHPAGLAGANYTYGAYNDGPQPGPVGIWTNMSITTSFSLSGMGDAASLTGFAQVVPEPTSVALIALGGLALARRTRRSV